VQGEKKDRRGGDPSTKEERASFLPGYRKITSGGSAGKGGLKKEGTARNWEEGGLLP